MFKKLTSATYQHMPWKNGQGTTIQIAIYPDNATLDNFVWRISRAAVNVNGAFSHFEGIDRTLALLAGKGMQLDINNATQTVDCNNPLAVFAGDEPTNATLIDGAIDDFNVMTRRAQCTHQVTLIKGAQQGDVPANTVLIYCAAGAGQIMSHAIKATLQASNPHITALQADQAIQFISPQTDTTFTLHSHADSVFYCVQISMRA